MPIKIIDTATRNIVASVVSQHIMKSMISEKLVHFVENDLDPAEDDKKRYILIIQDHRTTWNKRGAFAEDIQELASQRQLCDISAYAQLPLNLWVFKIEFYNRPADSALWKIRQLILEFLAEAVI